VFGQTFIYLWAGSEYADAFWVAVLTMFPLCIPLIQNTGMSFVVAQNKHQFRSVVYLIIAVANVISTYLIVPYMGIIGAALCSCVSYLLGQGLIMNIYYYKVTGLDIPLFWKNILKMAIIPVLMLVAGLLLRQVVVIDNWITFLAGVALFTAVYALLMYGFAMNDYEKDIIRAPLKRILRVLGRK
jgi:O-antigen/teichoic acid export membrane protein